MASAPATLVHGDAKLENLGVSGNRLVAIDWGELTGIGPAEIDVAWLAMMSGWRMDALPDEVFAAYDRRLDPWRSISHVSARFRKWVSSWRADPEQRTSQHANEPRCCSAGGSPGCARRWRPGRPPEPS